jgi:hypothetical protein
MKKFVIISIATTLAASMCVLASATVAADVATGPTQVAGEKLDSGLGNLPHYSQWADKTGKIQVAGEKQDNGLGDLPHYSQWADPTGKNPLQARVAAPASGKKQAGASVHRDGKQAQQLAVQVSQHQ